MNLLIQIILVIIFVIGMASIIILQFDSSTNLNLKKLLVGGVLSAAAMASILILGGAPFNKTFIIITIFMGLLGSILVFGRYVSNKIFAYLMKYKETLRYKNKKRNS